MGVSTVSPNQTLFDYAEKCAISAQISLATQETAIATVAEHNDSWVSRAVQYVKAVALGQRWLTTDDVWPLIPGGDDQLGSFRAMGPAMKRAQQGGYIQSTGRTNPCHCGRHRMPIRVWESLIYKGGE
jgi:hypothetical protein